MSDLKETSETCDQWKYPPLVDLSDDKKAKIQQLRELTNKWEVQEKERKFMNDLCLFRFLDGLQWDVEAAAKQLKITVDWRAENNPEKFSLKDVEKVARTGYMFHYGFDKQDQPVVYMLMGKDKTPNDEEGAQLKLKNIIYIMEQCIKKMKPGVYKITWIVDLKDSNLSLSTVKQVKDMFTRMGDMYTERMCRCLVINAGWTINMIWSFMKPFLAKETVEKFQVISSDIPATFQKYIDKSQLLKEFGGDVSFTFDYEKALAEEIL